MIYVRTELVEFPRSCFECPYGRRGKYWSPLDKKWVEPNLFYCCITNKAMTSTKRNRFCPLVAEWMIGDWSDKE